MTATAPQSGRESSHPWIWAGAITAHWHELVTVALLGTDRRDPPEPPAGPLADVVADALAPSPSARMLTDVAACVAARRGGLRPLAPADPLAAPPRDDRPLAPPAAARRWWRIIVDWPVLEDEWLTVAERAGWRLAPDVLVGLLRRHRTDAARRARVLRMGGDTARWLLDHQPWLRSSPVRREPPALDHPLPALAMPPELLAHLAAGPDRVVPAVLAGLRGGTFGTAHRAVLVNFVARARADTLLPLAAALSADNTLPNAVAGLAHSLADLAATRARMLEELAR